MRIKKHLFTIRIFENKQELSPTCISKYYYIIIQIVIVQVADYRSNSFFKFPNSYFPHFCNSETALEAISN